MSITEQEFKEWLQLPVTKVVRQLLASKRADLRNEWETSDPNEYLKDDFVLANVGNIGYCKGLTFAEQIDYEQYMTDIDDMERANEQD